MNKPKYMTQIGMEAPVVDPKDVTTKEYVDDRITELIEEGAARTPGMFAEIITGDGEATEFVVTHPLNTRKVSVQTYDIFGNQVWFKVKVETTTEVRIFSAVPIPHGVGYSVVISGLLL